MFHKKEEIDMYELGFFSKLLIVTKKSRENTVEISRISVQFPTRLTET